jgi:hypothetical protein
MEFLDTPIVKVQSSDSKVIPISIPKSTLTITYISVVPTETTLQPIFDFELSSVDDFKHLNSLYISQNQSGYLEENVGIEYKDMNGEGKIYARIFNNSHSPIEFKIKIGYL